MSNEKHLLDFINDERKKMIRSEKRLISFCNSIIKKCADCDSAVMLASSEKEKAQRRLKRELKAESFFISISKAVGEENENNQTNSG